MKIVNIFVNILQKKLNCSTELPHLINKWLYLIFNHSIIYESHKYIFLTNAIFFKIFNI